MSQQAYIKYQHEKQQIVQKIDKYHISLLKAALLDKHEGEGSNLSAENNGKKKSTQPLSIGSSFNRQSEELKQREQLLTACLNMLCLLMNCKTDSREYISKLISSNSFKVELMFLQPEHIDQNLISECIRVISSDIFEDTNYQEVISIIIKYTICCILINAGNHKFIKNKGNKNNPNILIQNEGYANHRSIIFGDSSINNDTEYKNDYISKTPGVFIHSKRSKSGKGSIQYANLDIFEEPKIKLK